MIIHQLICLLSCSVDELSISVGRDSRLSGEKLTQAVTTTLSSLGLKVYDFALASTPAMFMSTIVSDVLCDGAMMLTASHLPFNRNGIKFFTANGGLEKQNISEILTLAAEQELPNTKEQGQVIQEDFIAVYADLFVDKIRKGVNHPDHYDTPLQGLKIIVDAGNGAGGFYADKVLRPLGADITGSQFLEPDGTFPNHIPNPENKEAMASICQAVIDNNADFGIIFDNDVDRGAAVDADGKPLNRNRLIALISAIVLQEHPQSTIVTDSITSDGLSEFIEQLDGKHHRFRRGYKNVINESMRLNNEGEESHLAIETSGHGALQENYFLDDGAYLVTKLLIELAKSNLRGQNLTDLIASLAEPEESQEFRLDIKTENFQKYGKKVIESLEEFVETQSDWRVVNPNYEGIRVKCLSDDEQGWFLLRLSLHDPVMPINIETNVAGGVSHIVPRLLAFFSQWQDLDLSSMNA